MTISKGTLFAGLLGPLAAALLAAGCSGSVGPQAPRFDTAPTVVRITGLGQIGTGSPSPGDNVQTFNFDVRSDLTGSLKFSDYSTVRADGSVGTLTVDPTDAATAITAFRTSSSACSDPSNGAEFDGTGREDAGGGGGLLGFTVVACDNGPAGSALDFFSLAVPSDAYQKSGSLTSGDVAKSTISSSGGSLVVSTSTTGSSLPTSGYTVTVDPGTSSQTSQPIATNGSVTFSVSASSHSVVLSGVPANCTVSGGTSQTVTVPSGGTGTAAFSVSCVPVATALVFTAQPGNAFPFPLATIQPPVQVTTVDAQGNAAPSFNGLVTIAIGHDASLLGNAHLHGTTTVPAVNGVATFSDLSIDQPGIGYTLAAAASGLTGSESASFTILTPLPLP